MRKFMSVILVFVLVTCLFSPWINVYAAAADAKIDENLTAALSTSTTSTATAIVSMADGEDTIMSLFKAKFPYEYAVYMYAKYDQVGSFSEAELAAITDEDMQTALECKRQVYREYYSAYNSKTIDAYYDAEDILFVSSYTPMAIVKTDALTTTRLSRNADVLSISEYVSVPFVATDMSAFNVNYTELMTDLTQVNDVSRADRVRDTKGYTGAGVKIGMIEPGVPNTANPYLSSASITVRTGDISPDTDAANHATTVACIMVAQSAGGTYYGVAPEADLYSCSASNGQAFFEGIEWLISSGVNVINMSADFPTVYGTYDQFSQWVDHIAVQHDVHFVVVAGNNNDDPTNFLVTSPGMAYNAITVGSFIAPNGYDLETFSMPRYSRYTEFSTTVTPEKPNLVAMGTFNTTDIKGTSFAAPQVTGVIAQLCHYKSALKYKQSAVGAILSASMAQKANAVGNGATGDSFPTGLSVDGNNQISDKEGVGILNAYWVWWVATTGNYWSPTIYASSFPYTTTVTVDTSSSSVTRVAIFWLKRNTAASPHTSGTVDITTYPFANLNLYVYAPNGTLVRSSTVTNGNFEVVQFVPTVSGTYTIKITGTSSDKEYVGIAVW